MTRSLTVLSFALFALAACGSEQTPLAIAVPDRARFEQEVYPVLLRDCSFEACHGSSERFFQVYGPGRTRLPPIADPLEPVSPAELGFSYDRARSMIDVAKPERSLLLRKPLAASAGGSGHEGADSLGRNVYQTKLDPGYVAIAAWVLSQGTPTLIGGSGGSGGSTTTIGGTGGTTR